MAKSPIMEPSFQIDKASSLLSSYPWLASLSSSVQMLWLDAWLVLLPSHAELTRFSEPFIARELLLHIDDNEEIHHFRLIFRVWGRTVRRERVLCSEEVLKRLVEDFFVHNVVCPGQFEENHLNEDNLDDSNIDFSSINDNVFDKSLNRSAQRLVAYPFCRRVSRRCLQLFPSDKHQGEAVVVCRECQAMTVNNIKKETEENVEVAVDALDVSNEEDNFDGHDGDNDNFNDVDYGDQEGKEAVGVRRSSRRPVKREAVYSEINFLDEEEEREENDEFYDEDFFPNAWANENETNDVLNDVHSALNDLVKLEDNEEQPLISVKSKSKLSKSKQKLPKKTRMPVLELPNGRLACDQCPGSNRTYSGYRQLSRHKREFHLYGTFGCCEPNCEFVAHYPQDIVSHIEHSHSPETAYQCKLCQSSVPVMEFVAHYTACLTEHVRNVREANTRQCHLCGQRVAKGMLKSHMLGKHENSKPYKCELCDFATSYKGSLKTHRMRKHPTTEEREEIHRAKKEERASHMCDMCGKTFHSDRYLQEHKLVIHMNQQRRFSCPDCDEVFWGKQNLLRHRNKEHTNDPKFDCPECGKRFGTTAAVRKHMRMHSDPQFVCTVCGKGLKSAASLVDHMRIHTGEKPYKCKLCDYRCMSSNTLSLHTKFKHRNGQRSQRRGARVQDENEEDLRDPQE